MELAELLAERFTQRDWARTLDHAVGCVEAQGADVPHRVGAAICALKLASNLGAVDTMKRVYQAVRHLTAQPSVTEVQRLTLEMVHETICGDQCLAAAASRKLLAIAERSPLHPDDLPLMLDCVTSLRRGGEEGEAEEVCASLLDGALKYDCHEIADAAFTHLMEMHLDADRIDAASELKRARERWGRSSTPGGPPAARIAVARLHARLEQWRAARRLLSPPGGKSLCCDDVAMSRSAALATMVRVDCGTDAKRARVAGLLEELIDLNRKLQGIGAQDYETCSVALAQRYVGKPESADRTLRSYVENRRRDRRPFSIELAIELDRIDLGLRSEP